MRIGFIAVAGVRAQNKELVELGLTLPGFIERKEVIASLPSLGLLTLAGLTPPDVEVEYIEMDNPDTCENLPTRFDAVAISSFTAKIRDAYRLADSYRALGIKVILGGLHVTAMPQEAAAHADSVVLGEGELAWPQVVEDLKNRSLKGVYDCRGKSFDLANAPMPRFDLLDPARYNRITVQTQRGCPFNCEFCAASVRISPAYKLKPVHKVIAEIHKIKEIWPQPFIEFADDNTFVNKEHSKRLVKALIPEKIRWFTETDISVADDPELLSLLRDSGCAQILVGLETPNPAGLEGLEMKSNWKKRRRERYIESIHRIQSYGITVNGCFVLGLDNTGLESFQETLNFIRAAALFEAQITLLTPFPGTPLYVRMKNAGRLLQEDAWESCTLFDVNFRPANMTVAELESNFRWLMQRVYDEDFIKSRRQRFYQQLRDVRREENQKRRLYEYKVG